MNPAPRRLPQRPTDAGLRQRLYDIIFEAETRSGRAFDIALLILILSSICVIALETVSTLYNDPKYQGWFTRLELMFAVLFGTEYLLRCYCVRKPLRYIFSFWGLVDLLSFLPSLLVGLGSQRQNAFMSLRSIRLLRVFRVLKLWRMMSEADVLATAIWRSRDKIIVFLSVVLVAVTISATLMYHVESSVLFSDDPASSQFTSIPQAMYWAIVTMTTVGYGDVVPTTIAGKIISAMLILLGYSMIIVPTGFVSAEFSAYRTRREPPQIAVPQQAEIRCAACDCTDHLAQAVFCQRCGSRLRAVDAAVT